MLRQQFIAPQWQTWLKQQSLTHFESWWDLDLTPVDSGNHDRGGWSQVFRFEKNGEKFYVKKQSNHSCFHPCLRPFSIISPTFKAEFDKIARYQKADIPALNTVYFSWTTNGQKEQAILVTEALDSGENNYTCLNTTLASGLSTKHRFSLATAVGEAILKLHNAGIEHHNLYPKHIYAQLNDHQKEHSWHIRFIDLETSRSHFGMSYKKIRELETLSRRIHNASKTDRLRVLLAYCHKTKVDKKIRNIITKIQRRHKNKLTR